MRHDRLSARSLACGVFGVVRLAAGGVMADTGNVNVDTLVESLEQVLTQYERAMHELGWTMVNVRAKDTLSDLAARAREADDLRWKLDDERQAYEHTVRRRNDYREWGEAQQERAECSEAHEKKLRGDRDRLARRVAELEAALPRVIAMAILHRDWESEIANTVPQPVSDALYDEGLVANRVDETGERTPYLTPVGEDALVAALSGDGDGAAADTVFAWLIERGQPEKQVPTVWLSVGENGPWGGADGWVQDANAATKFPTREAAEQVIAEKFTHLSERSARAVEHGWLLAGDGGRA